MFFIEPSVIFALALDNLAIKATFPFPWRIFMESGKHNLDIMIIMSRCLREDLFSILYIIQLIINIGPVINKGL